MNLNVVKSVLVCVFIKVFKLLCIFFEMVDVVLFNCTLMLTADELFRLIKGLS